MIQPCKFREKDEPIGYAQWQTWVEDKLETHKQSQCSKCGKFHVWVKKEIINKKEAL